MPTQAPCLSSVLLMTTLWYSHMTFVSTEISPRALFRQFNHTTCSDTETRASMCSGHGTLDPAQNCRCVCDPLWSGKECSTPIQKLTASFVVVQGSVDTFDYGDFRNTVVTYLNAMLPSPILASQVVIIKSVTMAPPIVVMTEIYHNAVTQKLVISLSRSQGWSVTFPLVPTTSPPAPARENLGKVRPHYKPLEGLPTGQWVLSPQQPPPRSKHGQAVVGNDMLVFFGGRDRSRGPLHDAWTYNTSTQRFAELKLHGNLPSKRHSASVVTLYNSRAPPYGSLYVWGGTEDENSHRTAQTFYCIDPITGDSVSMPAATEGRYRHETVVIQRSKMLVLFGIGRSVHNDVLMFDSETNRWSELVPRNQPPQGRFNPCCAALNDTAVICFGGTRENVTSSNEVYVFDIITRMWEELVPTSKARPSERRLASCFVDTAKRQFTISHGWSSERNVAYHDMWDYDWVARAWTLITDAAQGVLSGDLDSTFWTLMPQHRTVYMFGGRGATALNSLWTHNLVTRNNKMIFGTVDKPIARRLHCMVVVGTRVFLLFGAGVTTVFDEIWSFNIETEMWEQLRVSKGPMIAVFGASCVVRGNFVVVFAGQTSLKVPSYTNDIYTVDISQALDGVVATSKIELPLTMRRPRERFSAAATLFRDDYFIVYGGKGARDEPFHDCWVYRIQSYEWSEAIRPTDPTVTAYSSAPFTTAIAPPPGYRIHHQLLNIGTEAILLVGGDDGVSGLSDRWIGHPMLNAERFVINFTLVQHTNTPPLRLSDVVRVSAGSIAGFRGNQFVFFGGSMDSMTAVERSSMHLFNLHTQLNTILPEMPITTSESPAVYARRSVYLFGGRRSVHGIVSEPISDMQKFTFSQASICPSYDDRSGCMTCPVGFIPPLCEPCPINTYFSINSSRCEPCPNGEFTKHRGMVGLSSCTITMVSLFTVNTSSNSSRSTQPRPFTTGQIPTEVWLAVGLAGSISVITIIFLILGFRRMKQNHRDRYITADMRNALERVYTVLQGDSPEGLAEGQLFVLMLSIASERSRYLVTEQWINDLLTKHDEDGSRQIELEELEEIILGCCLNPKEDFSVDWERLGVNGSQVHSSLKPLPNESDPRYASILDSKKAGGGVRGFSLKTLDFFTNEHTAGRLGEAFHFKAQETGAFAFFFFVVCVVFFLSALIGEFIYANEIESRSTLPYPFVPFDIRSDIVVTYMMYGSGFVANDMNETCGKFKVDVTKDAKESGDMDFTSVNQSCTFEQGMMKVVWICRSCYLGSDSVFPLKMVSSDDRAYARRIEVIVRATTGITDGNGVTNAPSTTQRYEASPPNFLLRGVNHPTVFELDAFPTVFGTKADIEARNRAKTKTGYHVYLTASRTSAVALQDITSVNGLCIIIRISVRGSSTLIVARKEIQDTLNFLSGVMGLINGLVGACTTIMKAVDRRLMKRREAEIKASNKATRKILVEQRKANVEATNVVEDIFKLEIRAGCKLSVPGCPTWYRSLESLILAGVTPLAAKAQIEVMVAMSEKAWPQAMREGGSRSKTPSLCFESDTDDIATAYNPHHTVNEPYYTADSPEIAQNNKSPQGMLEIVDAIPAFEDCDDSDVAVFRPIPVFFDEDTM